MKILHLCINSNVFGKNYAYQENLLAKAHRKLGHEVSIITSNYSEFDKMNGKVISVPEGEDIYGDGIRLIRLKPVFPLCINHSVHCFYGVEKYVNEIQPDFIFAHGIVSLNYWFLKNYKNRNPKVKIVFDNHVDFNNSCKNLISYIYTRYIVRYCIANRMKDISNFFYGVTPARCDFLKNVLGIPENKISLLPMGADDDEMHFERKNEIRQEIRNKYHIASDDFLIVTGGKIDPLKNIHVLAEAVSCSMYKKIKLIIFGSIRNDLINIFDNFKTERIQCIGWIPSNEVYNYFYAADLVIFPGLHSVLWEQAVASQVPCAFSKIKGFEHVDIGGNCILMVGKTVEYYKITIEKLYENKEYYHKLLINSHSNAVKQFLYSHIAQKVIDDINSQK